jgi:hypothetical protein
MTKEKTPQQLGHEFQDEVQKHLMSLQTHTKTYSLRLYDTKSAGNFLPAQPGDFISVHEGRGILVEAKSSGAVSSLSENRKALTSLFDKEQIAKMRLWHRAGGSVSVIFKCQKTKSIEVWDGKYIGDCFVTPRLRADKTMAYKFKWEELNAACLFMLKGRMK